MADLRFVRECRSVAPCLTGATEAAGTNFVRSKASSPIAQVLRTVSLTATLRGKE